MHIISWDNRNLNKFSYWNMSGQLNYDYAVRKNHTYSLKKFFRKTPSEVAMFVEKARSYDKYCPLINTGFTNLFRRYLH